MATKGKNVLLEFATVPLSVVTVGFVIAAALSVFLLMASANRTHSQTLTRLAADAAQRQVDVRVAELVEQVKSAATSSLLTRLVTENDRQALASEENQLQQLIPGAVRVRLFPLNGAEVNRSENPPFTFTSLDMVNRVETGQKVYPEAINNNGTWILSLAAPIHTPEDKTVRGTLFVYLGMDALSRGLSDSIDGQASLTQAFANLAPKQFLTLGANGSGEVTVTRSLQNPVWEIRFKPSAAIVDANVAPFVTYLLPILVLFAAAVIGILLTVNRLFSRVTSDAAHLANQMADVIAGDYSPSNDYRLHMFVDLDANLARLGKRDDEKPEVKKLNVTLQPKQTPREEMVDIEMIDEEEFEAAMAGQGKKAPEPEAATEEDPDIAEIFRAYDIRGVVNETLTPPVIRRIGLAIGTEAGEMGEQTLIVGADGRISSPAVLNALVDGLIESGRDVINIGMVPTPVLYFATHNSETRSGVMVTASHNPPEYNGFKIVLGGKTLVEDDINRIYRRFQSGDFSAGNGDSTEIDVTDDYLDAIADDIVVAQPLKIVVDCGNGVAGNLAPQLFENLGCDVVSLHCEVDGNFPNHPPDPTVPANLKDLILMVKSEDADMGIALDGDGDRVVVVTGEGEIIWPDRLLMLFAKDVVSRNPGSDVVYDVKCSRHLNSVISSFGGRPIICRSGHSFVKQKMAETDAVLGGEMSGHICFGERWFGFDDGLYSAARLLEIVGSQTETLSDLLEEFPKSVSTPELHVAVPEQDKFRIVDELIAAANFDDGTVTEIDGLRVDFAEGWGLVRASNTQPCLTLRFEADDKPSLDAIEDKFRELLKSVDESLDF